MKLSPDLDSQCSNHLKSSVDFSSSKQATNMHTIAMNHGSLILIININRRKHCLKGQHVLSQ